MIDWMSDGGIKKEESRMTPRFLAGATLEPLRGRRRRVGEEGDGLHCEHVDLLIPVGDPSGDASESAVSLDGGD